MLSRDSDAEDTLSDVYRDLESIRCSIETLQKDSETSAKQEHIQSDLVTTCAQIGENMAAKSDLDQIRAQMAAQTSEIEQLKTMLQVSSSIMPVNTRTFALEHVSYVCCVETE